ncbi:sulfite reductase (NADPH) flavoprotein alpha-component [Flavobacterium limicola]|uniref:NADPH--hemoprotein reductase n=1 Tax=Flavobacterium limicola TaxID=180441 RepID=A0A495S6Y9_9FLAO|nr:PepSY domain-containing protein [Flavobacterium limicola]RKS95582.1 sulfite reductase (NADPH) flavoprotein alpha-component [Flavobacterium limicola]
MTLSFWRYAHLALAVFSAAFLVLASVTGVILAVDAIQEKTPPYKVENFDKITLGETLPILRKTYPEITELSVNHNQFVTLQGIDQEDNDVNAYIDARTGKILGEPIKKSEFIQWTTALHRSLFLKETGRFIVGFVSFLLVLISISGFALILNRQRSLRSLFSKIVKENFAQYYHIFLGRLSLIPILIIALSGTYLTLEKFNFFLEKTDSEEKTETVATTPIPKKGTAISVFKNTLLADVQKIEFPFSDDPEEYYIITLKDREIEVNQITGAIVSETPFPLQTLASNLSLDLHTGRSSILWAIILGIASLNILFFIYSGFAMTLKRRASRIKNKYKAQESTFILLVGSENGSTLLFANAIQKQLLAHGEKVFLTELNNYSVFPKAKHLIVFTSTHGLGDAPSNASKFILLINKTEQQQKINVSVVGFGSKAYPDFCGYAQEIDVLLAKQNWVERFLELQTVNDKSAEEFVGWVKLWSAKTGIPLSATPSLYNEIPKDLEKMTVLDKTAISDTEHTFLLTLRTSRSATFTSGDLLAIYPANDNQERLYSIGNHNGNIQLVVKLHPSGLGSGYLYNAEPSSVFKARIIKNKTFHFPKKESKVALISNGTGIAPFLGMMEQNKKKTEIHLYCGFRKATETVLGYEKFAAEMIQKQQLQSFHLALSREENHNYVMDLIKRDADFFLDLLTQEGVVMICGSLAMQKDVEAVLNILCLDKTSKGIADYKSNGQVLTDCY